MWLKLAWRLFRHEIKQGELTVILAAIILSVSAVLSLSLFSERLQVALTDRTAEFLAADRRLDSFRQPADQAWIEEAQNAGIRTATQIRTSSMAFGNGQLQLVDLRAVNSQYPLKGTVKIADEAFGVGQETETLPEEGEVWVDSQLMQRLGLSLGSELELGDAIFTVAKVLIEIPDLGFSAFGGNSTVLISQNSFAQTNLAGPGSRVRYVYFFAGEKAHLDDYYSWLKPRLDNEVNNWSSVEDDQSALGRSIARAEHFFLLASLLAIILAAVAIAVAANRYSQRQYDPVAIMKTLGASRQEIQKVYIAQVGLITISGLLVGGVLGFVIQQAVSSLVASQFGVELAGWHWQPLLIAVFTGFICSFLFSLYPLLKLFSVPPLRVLRRDLGASLSSRFVQFFAAGGAILGLMLLYSRDIKISFILFLAGAFLIGALMLVTLGLIWVGRKLGQGRMGAWQLAWARIQRRALDNSVQLISFAVTIMLLLVVLVMRNDMVQQWRDQLPDGAANYFLANITHDQKDELLTHFAQRDVEIEHLYPVIRARFVGINDERINTDYVDPNDSDDTQEESDGRDGLGREANLTWSTVLHRGNEIVEGQWLDQYQAGDEFGVSVEAELAGRLDIGLGDTLTFDIGSEIVTVTVTSLRKVDWNTLQPNFLFVLQPEALDGFLPTYITSFYLHESRKSEIGELMQPFLSVSLFDVDARLDQLRSVIEQVSLAVEFILVLVLVAGSLVLIAQVQASMDERQQELAILRTLGAKGRLIRASVVYEFIIVGIVAGLMAAVANELTLTLLQTQVFELPASFHWEYWLTAPIAGAVVVGILGAASCWHLLTFSTSQLLRRIG